GRPRIPVATLGACAELAAQRLAQLLAEERDAGVFAVEPQRPQPFELAWPGAGAGLAARDYPVDPPWQRSLARAGAPVGERVAVLVGDLASLVIEDVELVPDADLVGEPFVAALVAVHARVRRVDPVPEIHRSQQRLAGQEPDGGPRVQQRRDADIGPLLILD